MLYRRGVTLGFAVSDMVSHLLGDRLAAVRERKINILVVRITGRLHIRIIIDRRRQLVVHMFKENIFEIDGPCVSHELQSLEKIQ